MKNKNILRVRFVYIKMEDFFTNCLYSGEMHNIFLRILLDKNIGRTSGIIGEIFF